MGYSYLSVLVLYGIQLSNGIHRVWRERAYGCDELVCDGARQCRCYCYDDHDTRDTSGVLVYPYDLE